MKTITKEELKRMLDKKENLFLINILSFEEFKKKHIQSSHNIPIESDSFKELILDTIDEKKETIILYGTYEHPKLRTATETLEHLGYLNVIEYPGGIEDWEGRFKLEGSES